MADTDLEFPLGLSGLTGATVDLFPMDSTTADVSGSGLTEQTNVSGFYRTTVSGAVSGMKRAVIKDGNGDLFGDSYIYLQDDTNVYRPLTRSDMQLYQSTTQTARDIGGQLDQQISTTESNIRGADNDTLKTLSDQVDGTSTPGDAMDLVSNALNNINAEVDDVLATDTRSELGSAPAADAPLSDKLTWLAMLARNRRVTTDSQDAVRDDGDTTNVATASLNDTGSQFERGEYS